MKLTLLAESARNGNIAINRHFDSGPTDLAERANLVHALRMFANSLEATPISAWQIPEAPIPPTLLEPAILEDAAWSCT